MPLYVDHTQLVKITLLARDKELALIVSNTVRPDAKPGTGLGLQNCAQILRLHSGRFEHSLSEGVFTAAAYFPMERVLPAISKCPYYTKLSILYPSAKQYTLYHCKTDERAV